MVSRSRYLARIVGGSGSIGPEGDQERLLVVRQEDHGSNRGHGVLAGRDLVAAVPGSGPRPTPHPRSRRRLSRLEEMRGTGWGSSRRSRLEPRLIRHRGPSRARATIDASETSAQSSAILIADLRRPSLCHLTDRRQQQRVEHQFEGRRASTPGTADGSRTAPAALSRLGPRPITALFWSWSSPP